MRDDGSSRVQRIAKGAADRRGSKRARFAEGHIAQVVGGSLGGILLYISES